MTDNQSLAKIEPMPVESADRHAGPLDMEPTAFRAGLDRRKENRKALMEWIRSALVENIDFGRIQTKRGPSKPSLFKPGAEKICGMLGVITTFPTLTEYEQAALKGVEIKSIVLRCALLDSRGVIVAEGVGARSMAQDYGDLNKVLKMAEKSAHIDATLRMAGLSEVFTQDIEDMPKDRDIEPAKAAKVPQGTKPSEPQKAGKAPPDPSTPATEEQRVKWVKKLKSIEEQAVAYGYANGILLPPGENGSDFPGEPLECWPLNHTPSTNWSADKLFSKIQAWKPGVHTQNALKSSESDSGRAEIAKAPQNAPQAAKRAPTVPQSASNESQDHHQADWYQFPVPFGKHSGIALGKLDKNVLFGFWANFTVETEFKGKPKKKETIEKDRQFRAFLDAAGVHYRFDEPKSNDPEQDGWQPPGESVDGLSASSVEVEIMKTGPVQYAENLNMMPSCGKPTRAEITPVKRTDTERLRSETGQEKI